MGRSQSARCRTFFNNSRHQQQQDKCKGTINSSRHIQGFPSGRPSCRLSIPDRSAPAAQSPLLTFSESPLEVLPRRCALNLEASVRQAGFLTSPNPRPSAPAHHLFHRFPHPTPSEYPARVDIPHALADAILLTPILAIFTPGGGRKQSTLRTAAPIGACCAAWSPAHPPAN